MATVVKKLFGLHPSFLELKSQKSLYETISHLPKYGVGQKVQPTNFFNLGKTKNYYIVTKVFPESRHCYGIRIKGGKKNSREIRICDKFKQWGLFNDPLQITRINKALLQG